MEAVRKNDSKRNPGPVSKALPSATKMSFAGRKEWKFEDSVNTNPFFWALTRLKVVSESL